ncbi:MAG: FAD-dependent thymidylate synthase [Oscillospiraceae bacterium]|jgi:thymidylate synthase (FAD)|nr:FAD-dependent thymidylate synthase [Oscillospiraceae bacterium]
MKIIEQSFDFINPPEWREIPKRIELIGRVCYKSEDKITADSAARFIANIIKRGHESVLEHVSFTVRFVTDRGVTHEIVRHRVASYSQESTRYCNYGDSKGGLTVIKPYFADNPTLYSTWKTQCESAETAYNTLLADGATPEAARSILPNSLKTELVMTANLREWRHFIGLRADKSAHPQLRGLTVPFANTLNGLLPEIFPDKYV